MERPGEGEQPPQEQPWGRLLRLGAEEGEPHVLLRKREWTIGRRRGCDLSFPGNKLVSGDHCKITVDEKSGQVSLEDTSANGTVINKLKVVKRQTCPLQTGDVIYLVYRKNEPEHNVAYLYESLNEKQGVTQDSFEANKENVFHVTKDTSGAGRGDDPQDPQVLLSSPATQVCFEEPQPSTSTSDLFPKASTSSMEPTSAGRGPPSSSSSRGADVSPKGCGPSVTSDEISSFPVTLPNREGASFSLSEPQDQEDLEPVKKKVKADGEPDLNLPVLVTDPGRDRPAAFDVRAEAMKPDKMEETLTCIICQDLLHDCVSLQPCMHTFCAACYSGWMERSALCPTCRCPVERICKNHILNNLVEAYLLQHPDKRRSEEDLHSMAARNKITQDMLQPKVRRAFSDEEGSSEDLLELSDVDSESSDVSQPSIVCRQCPEYRRQAGQPLPYPGPGSEPGAPQAPGDAPSTSASVTAAQDYVCALQGSHAICTCCFQPMPDRRAEREQDPRIAPQQCAICLQPFCHLYWGCARTGCLGCLAPFCELNLGDRCLDGVLSNNNYESDVLKNYLATRGLTWKNMLTESLGALQRGVFLLSDYRGPGPGAGAVAAAGPAPAPPAGGSGGSGAGGSGSAREGWLFKWTNYIKGYQRRWFVLSNGLLSYYRSKAEMRHTCRGTINLATAHITVEDSCNFVISNGGAQTYHLKASSEVERQRWVTALELAKAKAVKMLAESDESGDEESVSQTDKTELQNTLRTLSSKVEDLSTCNDLIAKHGTALQRSLSELEALRLPAESSEKIKQVNERATLFRITSNAMINACRDFLALAQSHSRRWQRSLQYERDQRIRLEEALEQLAKQHNHLERAFRGATVLPAGAPGAGPGKDQPCSGKGDLSDEDDENEFFDAPEIITVPENLGHRRTGSNISGASSDISLDEQYKHQLEETKKEKRTRIPYKPNYSLNLWSIMKNCIGKELSKIPMPVNFNEPLSMLQRLTEDLEYHELLDRAAACESSLEQLCYVAAFTVSSYSTTVFRTSKPFNPLLGETFELDRLEENGYRSLCEQVSHHPPAAAHHAESRNGWTLRQEIKITSKFRGKYLSIMPLGSIHCIFHATGHHYTWKKVTTTVHNIIVGKLWIDQSGEIDIVNHKTGDKCNLKFVPYSYFSRDVARKVTGEVTDASGRVHFALLGTWDEKMDCFKVQPVPGENGGDARQRGHDAEESRVLLWKRNPLPKNAENMYYFSELALTLNAWEAGTAPTDSRLRPDQRLMENGRWDEANAEKQRLEEKQRLARKKREAEAMRATEDGAAHDPYKALWFERRKDPVTRELTHIYRGGYWECKERQDWDSCPDIF